MYLQKLTIENIRVLEHFEMTFPEHPAGWHVVIGDNGAGKSTLIRAISLGLIGPTEVRAATPNFAEWLRKGAKSGSVELALECDADYDFTRGLGRNRSITAKVILQSSYPLGKLLDDAPLVEAIAAEHKKLVPGKYLWSNSDKGWFSAGFGPFRRFTGGDAKHDRIFQSSPLCGAHLSVFGEDVALTEALRWLKEIDYKQLKAREEKARQDINPIKLASGNKFSIENTEKEEFSEVRQLWEIAGRLQKSSLFEEAESVLRHALSMSEKVPGASHHNVATSLNNLAMLLKDINKLSEAQSLIRQALSLNETNLGPDHPSVAVNLNNLATLLKQTNQLVEAEVLMRRAVAINEASLGPDHPRTAASLNNLALLLQDTNRLAEAEPLMRRALAIEEAHFGPDHPEVSTSLNNLAVLLKYTNRFVDAEPLMRRALYIDETNLGANHPTVATDLNNLADLLKEINQTSDAEALMRRALAITETHFGPDHPTVAIRLNNLALLLQDTNRLAEAESLMRRALTIVEDSFGPDHPAVANQLDNLSILLLNTNRMDEAEPLMRRALSTTKVSFGDTHPTVAIRLNNLASFLLRANRLTEAELLVRQALIISENSFGPNHPTVSITLSNLSVILRLTNNLAEAESLARRALSIDENSFGVHHPTVDNRLQNLIYILQHTDKAVEAEDLKQYYKDKRASTPKRSTNVSIANVSQKLPLEENDWLAIQLRTFINESKLLPIGTEFKGMSTNGPLFRDGNNQIVAVTQLSDGFRSILSLAFELIRQLIRVYGLIAVFPPDGVHGVIKVPGVVLIDEVDTHLHPTWQTRIGQWFTHCFPKIQFIVTTHSPLVCRAVTETTGSIWRLPTPGQGQKVEEVTGTERERLRLGTVLDAYGTGLFGGQEVEQAVEATALLAERAQLSAKDAVGKATPTEQKRLRELQQLFSSTNAEIEY